jgi:hypothetical protein
MLKICCKDGRKLYPELSLELWFTSDKECWKIIKNWIDQRRWNRPFSESLNPLVVVVKLLVTMMMMTVTITCSPIFHVWYASMFKII